MTSNPPALPVTQETQPWTVGRLLTWTADFLKDRGSDSPRLDAEVLLAHARGCPRIALYTDFGETVTDDVRDRFRQMVRRRAEGAPVAYLVGHKEFFSLEFAVSPAVLIPRPETEFVVMEFLTLAKDLPAPKVVDVGTGSGNIAVAVARHHPGALVTAIDISREALALAGRNAETHGVADRIRFVESDLFDAIEPDAAFDFVLSNPPYVASDEWDALPGGVRDYEPRVALDGGRGGTEVVDRLIGQAAARLNPGGHLILEIGAPQEEAVRRLVAEHEGFILSPTLRDYSGHPRVVRARWTGKA